MRRIVLFVSMVLVVASAFGQGYQDPIPGQLPTAAFDKKQVRTDQNLGAQVPMTAQFVDSTGVPVTFANYTGKRPIVLLPIFYKCISVCAVELQLVLDCIDQMPDKTVGKDFNVVVVSIDPKEGPRDASDKLKQTLASIKHPGDPGGWHFLTGTMPNIRAVTDPIGFHFTYDADKDFVTHPAAIMVLTPAGTVSSYLVGAQFKVSDLRKDLDVATKSQIGEKSPNIFFGCVHIDPLTGKRSIVIENVLRVLGIGTVSLLVLAIVVLSGKARLKKPKFPERVS